MTSLVIRYSSMGDIVLTAGITKALAPVIFLTLERYASFAFKSEVSSPLTSRLVKFSPRSTHL